MPIMASRLTPRQPASDVPRPLGSLTDHLLLSAREEYQLAARARKGDMRARRRLVELNVRQLGSVVAPIKGSQAFRAGAPGGIRTPDPLLRRQPLYSPELRARPIPP